MPKGAARVGGKGIGAVGPEGRSSWLRPKDSREVGGKKGVGLTKQSGPSGGGRSGKKGKKP